LRGSSSPRDSPAQAARCCSARCLAMADADIPARHHTHTDKHSAQGCCCYINTNSTPSDTQVVARGVVLQLLEQASPWFGMCRLV
jgi:hypothetical protein